MRASASALSLTLFAAALLTATAYAPPADACGAIPPLYVTIDRVLPVAGTTDVGLDAAVLVDATGWQEASQFDVTYDLPKVLKVELTARGTSERVAGTIVGWTDGRAIFQPSQPLAPSTTYDAVAVVTNTQAKPAGNGGLVTSSTNFTTGSSSLPPLGFGGEPVVTFEDLDHEVCDPKSLNDCGGCGSMIPKRERFAVLTLPAPVGGDAIGGFEYGAVVSLVESDLPGAPSLGAESSVAIREPSRLPVPLFAAPQKYGICIETTVRDVKQKPVNSGRRCFTKEEVWAASTTPSTGGSGGSGGGAAAGAAGAPAVQESGPPAQDPGCAIAAPRLGDERAPMLATAILFGLALSVRRRRTSP